jgi:hypothetical protein
MSYKKRNECKYCEISFLDLSSSQRANHSRWCDKNPKRKEYVKILENARAHITEESRELNRLGISKAHASGKYEGAAKKAAKTRKKLGNHLHTEETKQLLREKALESPHRRLRKGMVEYKGIMLDSSWELELAKRLDELEIKWVRPNPIKWIDTEGITHNYFGDFYLTEHDLYLDPKNPQAIKVQKEKLDCLLTQHKNIVIIDSLQKCKEFSL